MIQQWNWIIGLAGTCTVIYRSLRPMKLGPLEVFRSLYEIHEAKAKNAPKLSDYVSDKILKTVHSATTSL